jgi:DNA-directed RNA polymerase subunit RPC12/RpoP
MSEADDLLIYGVAAAKANSRDEARNYLEWVLRTDADFDQQAEAWYWLSTITDDSVEKRSCLENVLAINPHYGDARRDLAILDGRINPDQIPDPRYNIRPISPNSELQPDELKAYKCPQCGARLTPDKVTGALFCTFCGYRPGDTAGPVQGKVAEQDWTSAIYAAKGHRWEVPTARTFKCGNCGASVLVPAGQVSTSCPFCGTPHVVHSDEEQDLIEPTGILPFRLSGSEALVAVTTWLGGQRFAPEHLGNRSTQATPRPVYLPFWTFDLDGEVRWTGNEVSYEFGRTSRVKTSGTAPLLFDDVIVPGTRSVPGEILAKMSFDSHALIPFSADALATWPAEIYSISAVEASLDARDKALHDAQVGRSILSSTNLAATVQDIAVTGADLSILTYKLAMLPVWIGAYTFEGQLYQVVVNGNSGEVEGNVPRNAVQTVLNHLLGGFGSG